MDKKIMNLLRQILIGGCFGASIAFSAMGFERNSLRFQVLGLWLIGVTIVGILSDFLYNQKNQ